MRYKRLRWEALGHHPVVQYLIEFQGPSASDPLAQHHKNTGWQVSKGSVRPEWKDTCLGVADPFWFPTEDEAKLFAETTYGLSGQ
jgi:hypothetical protein